MNLTTRWLIREERISGPHGFSSQRAAAGEKQAGDRLEVGACAKCENDER